MQTIMGQSSDKKVEEKPKPVVGTDGKLRCPKCRYALFGERPTDCDSCGLKFVK